MGPALTGGGRTWSGSQPARRGAVPRHAAGAQHDGARRGAGLVLEPFDATSYAELAEKYPAGSRERQLLAEFLGFFESAGVLVSRGLLHEDVFFDAPFALEGVWAKIGTILDEWQAAADPAVWENVTWLGRRNEVWQKTQWRPKLEAIPPDRGPA